MLEAICYFWFIYVYHVTPPPSLLSSHPYTCSYLHILPYIPPSPPSLPPFSPSVRRHDDQPTWLTPHWASPLLAWLSHIYIYIELFCLLSFIWLFLYIIYIVDADIWCYLIDLIYLLLIDRGPCFWAFIDGFHCSSRRLYSLPPSSEASWLLPLYLLWYALPTLPLRLWFVWAFFYRELSFHFHLHLYLYSFLYIYFIIFIFIFFCSEALDFFS